MNLLACFKVIPDLDQMTWHEDSIDDEMCIDTSFVKKMLNCFDESSLEFGLRLSDEAEGLNLHLTKSAVTVADTQAELYMQTLSALKYDHVIGIDSGGDIRFCPDIVGSNLVKYLETHPQDVVLMGRQAPEGNNFAVPQFVAEKLGLPLVANVVDIHLTKDGNLNVKQELDGNLYEQEVQPPVVCTIGNAVISKLRVPTLKDRMTYGKKAPIHIAMKEKRELYTAEIQSLTFTERSRSAVRREEGGSEAADYLYEHYLKGSSNAADMAVEAEEAPIQRLKYQPVGEGRVLIAVHGNHGEMIKERYMECMNMAALWQKAGYGTDIYLYTEETKGVSESFGRCPGRLFVDKYWYLSPGMAADHITELCRRNSYDGVLVIGGGISNEIAALTALKTSWLCVTDGTNIKHTPQGIQMQRMVYSNNVSATLTLPVRGFVISGGIRLGTSRDKLSECLDTHSSIEELPFEERPDYIHHQKMVSIQGEKRKSQVLIAVGRGIRTKGEVAEIRGFAQRRGYMFGVTRPVAMNGWGAMGEIIGVSGSVYAPKICIAIGISGAAAFYAGIEQSSRIVSINRDVKASIMKMSDECIIDDYQNILGALIERADRELTRVVQR